MPGINEEEYKEWKEKFFGQLKSILDEAYVSEDKINYQLSIGMQEEYDGTDLINKKPNGTYTITIEVAGGAKDTKIRGDKNE